jgi:outer membrane protein OmpA-like peptidoglycan-associated protein
VITLSGQVLFTTGKATLQPNAKEALSQVAAALKESGSTQQITIEGHADARGNEEKNLKLSKQRAEAVRDYLVSEGVPAERVIATGFGETRPVASNDTSEGRANNRRVEIVLGKEPMTPASGKR